MASIHSQITLRIKDAMRAQDKVRLATLRDVKSKFILEQTKTGATEDLDDSIAIKLDSRHFYCNHMGASFCSGTSGL